MPTEVLPTGLGSVAALDPAFVCRLLDQLEIACCVYDAADRARCLERDLSHLFFSEQRAEIAVGTSYAVPLARFFASNLPEAELTQIDRHVAAGVARYRSQQLPFVFQRKSGRWVRVASLPVTGG